MYKIKNLKTKKQITFEIPSTEVDNTSLLYCFDNAEWNIKTFKMRKNKFTCSLDCDLNVKSIEFIYLYNSDGSEYYVTDPMAEYIDNPFGTKNSIIKF